MSIKRCSGDNIYRYLDQLRKHSAQATKRFDWGGVTCSGHTSLFDVEHTDDENVAPAAEPLIAEGHVTWE